MFSLMRQQLQHRLFTKIVDNCAQRTFSNVCSPKIPCLLQLRHKSKKGKSAQVSESETETEGSTWDDKVVDKNTKVMQITVKSPRLDVILKGGLGIARNKIETFFYESKIRLNGQKPLKKSEPASEGDEIDIVKGASPENPNFLNVARVEVLEIREKGENLSIKIRRCKNLTIDSYDEG